MLDPSLRNSARYYWTSLGANNIETPHAGTVVLHFLQPRPTLLEELATTAAEMVSPTAAKTLGNARRGWRSDRSTRAPGPTHLRNGSTGII
jgi:hypothetical protein